ncbi:MAG: hypothetical protein K1X95_06720 [Acidimicrobiia bacterium]|nr:hypothetical protein [Acidimicrobiia bacterium]
MTTAVQPVPVGEKATKEGPNKVLLVILGIVAAAALFMFVVKPLLLDSKAPASPAQTPATTKAPTSAAEPSTKGGTTTAKPGTTPGSATPTAPSAADEAPAPITANPTADALPQIPQQYAGQQARDPFAPLVQTQNSSSSSSTTK